MVRRLHYFSVLLVLFCTMVYGQQNVQSISFEHFAESRGDAENGLTIEIPHSQLVVLENNLNTRSGFGFRLNFNGNMVIVDQIEVLRDGRIQVVLRREDGRNFYGYRPTLKAILSTKQVNEEKDVQLVENEDG